MSLRNQDRQESLDPFEEEDDLVKVCQCVVCLQILCLPVTWSCGHSFCKSCSAGVVLDMQSDRGVVKCPTCRKFANMASVRRFAVNTVLHAMIARTFPNETKKRESQVMKDFERIHAQLKGPTAESGFAGENGGQHTLGWEVVSAKESFMLKPPDVHGERNVVRDEADYAMHVALAPISSLRFIPCVEELSTWHVRFAMLEMEEDEVADGGFPISLHEHNDTNFMDLSLLRKKFEGTLECQVSVNGNVLGSLESEAVQGIGELDLGSFFRENGRFSVKDKSKLIKQPVVVIVQDPESHAKYQFTFSLCSKGDNHRISEHLKRMMPQKKKKPSNTGRSNDNSEGDEDEFEEGEDLESESDGFDEEEEEEEQTSLDGFIVPEDDEEEEDFGSPSPRRKKGTRNTTRSKNKVVEVVEDEEESEEEKEERYSKAKLDRKKEKHGRKTSERFVDSFIVEDDEDEDDEGVDDDDFIASEDDDGDSDASSDDGSGTSEEVPQKRNRTGNVRSREPARSDKEKTKRKTKLRHSSSSESECEAELVSLPSSAAKSSVKKRKGKAIVISSGDDTTPARSKKRIKRDQIVVLSSDDDAAPDISKDKKGSISKAKQTASTTMEFDVEDSD